MRDSNCLSDAVWAEVLSHVRTNHPAVSRGWFSQLRAGPLLGGEMTIITPNKAQLGYLVEHCLRPFVEAAQAATGRLVSVRFETPNGEVGDRSAVRAAGGDGRGYERSFVPLRLNGDYVFDNYVVGPSNQLAQASCHAVSESPGTVYNPLFIQGNSGLGKTHLQHAICHRVLDRTPDARIAYLTCESFVNDFIEAVERGNLHAFRGRYRHLDVLLIDDIQFLAGRDRTQEEFFHTFNTLYQIHRQIVLSADCPPSEIPGLEERLISRFKWGLVVRIDPPCLETRLAILRKKARLRGMDLPDDAAMLIAERLKSNSRELEGALNRLHGLAAMAGRPIDLALAAQALGDDGDAPPKRVRIQDIMNVVTERFDVKLSDLQGRRRSRSIALPRQVCMYLARQMTTHSLGEIGGFFGGRDHTTVLHASRIVADRREKDSGFRSRLEDIEDALRRR